MPNPIPTQARTVLSNRDKVCLRCLMPPTQLHHRRGRAVRDVHQHCPCNLVYLCDSCHRWAHAHPRAAMRSGFVVGRAVGVPGTIPVKGPDGWWELACDGSAVALGVGDVWFDDDNAMPYVAGEVTA